LLGLLLVAGMGAEAQTWSEYFSTEGRYRIDMPGKPKIHPVAATLDGGGKVSLVEAEVEHGGMIYLATHTDYAPRTFATLAAQEVLANTRDEAAAGNRLLSDRTLVNSGYPAREYVIQRKNGVTVLTRSALARNRLYQMVVTYPSDKPEPTDARRFVNSFTILMQ
jgi:hypothetical protein